MGFGLKQGHDVHVVVVAAQRLQVGMVENQHLVARLGGHQVQDLARARVTGEADAACAHQAALVGRFDVGLGDAVMANSTGTVAAAQAVVLQEVVAPR